MSAPSQQDESVLLSRFCAHTKDKSDPEPPSHPGWEWPVPGEAEGPGKRPLAPGLWWGGLGESWALGLAQDPLPAPSHQLGEKMRPQKGNSRIDLIAQLFLHSLSNTHLYGNVNINAHDGLKITVCSASSYEAYYSNSGVI